MVKTLLEGIVLVFLVMYLFLQNLRATLIPTIAVPVVLLGTFAIMNAVGFSINVLSMFGLVLAIGLLVDDAIVVVENVERVMSEEGLSPREATRKAMDQITGALVGVALVLSAVFVPVAFSGGSVGAIYRQFSLTIVSAMVLSVLVALVLTPALCATILKPVQPGEHAATTGFFGWFNRTFDRSRDKYHSGVHHVIRRSGRWLVIYLAVIVAVGFLFVRLPKSFLPDEDQGLMFVLVQTPTGSTQETTERTLSNISDYLLTQEKSLVESVFTVNGFSFAGRGQNSGLVFVRLQGLRRSGSTPIKRCRRSFRRMFMHYSRYKDAMVFPVNPPSIPELGTASGFDFELTDNARARPRRADGRAQSVAGDGRARIRRWRGVRPNGLNDTPQFKIDIDREKAQALGVSPQAIDQTFSVAWASQYVNNFLDTDNRIKKVYVHGRRAVPHVARRSEQVVRAQYVGHDGAVHVVLVGALDVRFAEARALQRHFVDGNPRRRGAGQEYGPGDASDAKDRGEAAGRHRLLSGRGCRSRKSNRARKRRFSTACRFSSCSCAWPRCMKVGRFRSRSSWSCRSA